ncbi:DUF418 domain-containing protein [Leucobacter sp. CSA2]|uniref:DUF418 domain-containing protein n=2 Tax=Leucobacter edaphi TaxID=2796472 RepID=A0A934QED5_9MICO|nr:DUF418 domain-containing protein [Leucobacter edaphi]
MLLFIALANIMVYLWGQRVNQPTNHPSDGTALDRGLSIFGMLIVEQRTYPMFAFLFGYGMVQFARSRVARGVPAQNVKRMLQRRHWWLIAFGAVHALLLFGGDILGAYGLAGLILTACFFGRSDGAIKLTVWIMVGLAALFSLLTIGMGALFAQFPVESLEQMGGMGINDTSNADLMAGESHFLLAMLLRVGMWLLSVPMTVGMVFVPASMLLGVLAARHRWLEVSGVRPSLGLVAAIGIPVGVLGGIPQVLAFLGELRGFESAPWAFVGVVQFTGMAGGIGYAALFGLIGQRLQGRESGLTRAIAAVGKRSLSFYLLQSVIFAPLLSAWGFGLGSRIGTAAAYAIAIGYWLLSILIAALLERRGARGPAEVLLRRLTYGKYDPAAPNAMATSGAGASPGRETLG